MQTNSEYKVMPCCAYCCRFQREYGKNIASDWFIANINEFVVREMTIAKGSDQQPK
jgi:hypothetical protein